ncbi:MAG: VirB8/TrbF family protein [Geminicoccaceae bacterium]
MPDQEISPDEERRYLLARQEWDDRYDQLARGRRAWRFTTIILLIGYVVLAVGFVTVSLQVRTVPFLVTENSLGELTTVRGTRLLTDLTPENYRAELSRFIRTARAVSTDADAQAQYIDQAYAFLSQGVASHLDRYYRANNPYKLSERVTRAARVQSVLQLSERTWQIRWFEDRKTLSGDVVETEPWIATVQVKLEPRRNPDIAMLNPSGLTITALDWSAELGGTEQ